MWIKKGVQKCNTKYFFLRTLCGKGDDPSSDCNANLRLDQDIVKLFKTDLRLENVCKNVWSEVGEVGDKSLDLGLNKKEHLSGILSWICPLALNKSWRTPNCLLQWMSGKSLGWTKKVLINTKSFPFPDTIPDTFHCSVARMFLCLGVAKEIFNVTIDEQDNITKRPWAA